MGSDLRPLLAPRSIAVVGASEGPRHGGELMRSLRDSGYAGEIVPINPRYESVYGHRCHPSLEQLGRGVECVVLAVGREHVPEQLRQAGKLGARGAVIISGGFREAGSDGQELERRTLEVAREYSIRCIGPNTIGLINVHGGVGCYAASLPRGLRPGPIAAIVQSGTVCGAMGGGGGGLRYSHLVSTGNEMDVVSADLVNYFVDDPATRVIVVYAEDVRRPMDFLRAVARARVVGKPVIVLKVGQSEAAQRVTASHTGALAGSGKVFTAMAHRYRLISVGGMNDMLATAELFAALGDRLPTAGGIAVMTHSGSEAALFLDKCSQVGLTLPGLTCATIETLRCILPDYAAPDNPLDTTGVGSVSGEVFRGCLEALVADPNQGLVAVMQDVRAGHWVLHQAARITAQVARTTRKPIMFFSNTARYLDAELLEILEPDGVPVIYGTEEAVAAAQALLRYAQSPPFTPPPAPAATRAGAIEMLSAAADEAGAKRLLALYGLPVTRECVCTDLSSAVAAATEIGFPVAVKILSPDLPHKTEFGGVRLDVRGPAELEEAIATITAAVRGRRPNIRIAGYLVQEMVSGAVAELILGIHRDPHYGPVVLCGIGGIFAEVLSDTSVRLVPLSETDALDMVEKLRGFPLLAGARGKPPGDVPALVDAICRLSDLAAELGDRLKALDINPVVVLPRGRGVRVVDAMAFAASPVCM